MTTMYIIFATILASILASVVFVFVGKIEHKGRKINLNWLVLMIAIALASILTMVLVYHNQNDISENNLETAYNEGYNLGYAEGWDDGISETRQPTDEEMEEWFSSTKEVLVGTNKGGDVAVHIIDGKGDEWVLFADK